MVIREAGEADHAAIARLNDLAFAGPDESALAARLRAGGGEVRYAPAFGL